MKSWMLSDPVLIIIIPHTCAFPFTFTTPAQVGAVVGDLLVGPTLGSDVGFMLGTMLGVALGTLEGC